jgi:hypothetical protein
VCKGPKYKSVGEISVKIADNSKELKDMDFFCLFIDAK